MNLLKRALPLCNMKKTADTTWSLEAAHLNGASCYVADMPITSNTLVGYVVTAPYACAVLKQLDVAQAKQTDGVVCVVTAADCCGVNQMGLYADLEPCLLPIGTCCGFKGQAVVLIGATHIAAAKKAAACIEWEWEEKEAVLNLEDALQQKSFVLDPQRVEQGNANQAIKNAPFQAQGTLHTGAQEHLYFETQAAFVAPKAQGVYRVWSATENPVDVQRIVAQVLGTDCAHVDVEAGCVGGSFGGKRTQSVWTAAWAAWLAQAAQRPVKLVLALEHDMEMTGKRHAASASWRVGFDSFGRILGLEVTMALDGGWCRDMSMEVVKNCLYHLDGPYYIPEVMFEVCCCKTNKPGSTAFGCSGVPQASAVIESVILQIATILHRDESAVRWNNYYQIEKNNTTPYNMRVDTNNLRYTHVKLCKESRYYALRKKSLAFNKKHAYVKRGVAMVPVKLGLTRPAESLAQATIQTFQDGSAAIHYPGTDTGQGLNDRLQQQAAQKLDIPAAHIRVCPHATTLTYANTDTSDTCSEAAPFHGFAMGMAAAYVEVSLLTGTFKVKDVWMVQEAITGQEAARDKGFLCGAYLQGLGWCSLEKIIYDQQGRLLTSTLEQYKIPGVYDIPDHTHISTFTIYDKEVVLKELCALYEMPFVYALAVWLALQKACGKPLPIPATQEELIKPFC